MRKIIIVLAACIIVNSALTHTPPITHAQQEIPTYAKWGKLAIKEIQLKYPNANIIDYLHVGTESKEGCTIERFKLWLKENDKEFGVIVRIEYTNETEKVINIEFQETSR